MNANEVTIALKNRAAYLEHQRDKGYVFKSSFMTASGYLKLMRFRASTLKWGSLWAGTKVFDYWLKTRD